jgi:hypothetical protein
MNIEQLLCTTSPFSQAVGLARPFGEIIDLGCRLAGGVDLAGKCGRKAY